MPTTITTSQLASTTFMPALSSRNSEEEVCNSTNHVDLATTSYPLPSSLRSFTTKQGGATNTASHTRRGSSATTESLESSPTTTISTADSTLTDPSPSSSPESPTITSLKDPEQTPTIRSMEGSRTISLDPSLTRQESRSTSPKSRLRNAKGLSINTAGISTIGSKNIKSGQASAASLPAGQVTKLLPPILPGPSLSDATRPFSEPSSPAFIVPQFPVSKRSKLGLTITTPDSRGNIGSVPQTPLRSMASLPLRTRASDLTAKLNPVPETPIPLSSMREKDETGFLFSPSLAPPGGMQLPPLGQFRDSTLPTPSFGPEGGMKFPASGSSESSPQSRVTRPPLALPRTSFDSPNSSSVVQHTIEHIPSTPLHDLPLSQEAKSPGYPEGPICIYPPSVFLYHQPTREEARNFDVIINVAREVTNPFLEPEVAETPAPEAKYKDAGIQCMLLVGPGEKRPEPVPESATSEKTFSSAFESIPEDEGPATPKAVTPRTSSDPEYIHLPWEHNSKVYEDWLNICEMIDSRVNQGKKVLIHCQLGVSRSASLIVAYGLYKNPQLTPDEAREQAKSRSRFIDLNMHFMYELGDFKKLLVERMPREQAPTRPGGPKAMTRTMTDSVLSMPSHRPDMMTPILDDAEEDVQHKQFAEASGLDVDNLGPSSAPQASIPTAVEPTILQPTTYEPENPMDAARAGDKTPKASEGHLKLTLPSIKTIPTQPPADIIIPKPSRTSDELKSPPPLQLALPPRPHIQNTAENTHTLPSPHLELPPTLSPVPAPRRTIRPMPSLPAGFSSIRRNETTQPPFPNLKLSIEALKSPTTAQGEELLSPRLQQFTATPFHRSVRSLAGDLAVPLSGTGAPTGFGSASRADNVNDPGLLSPLPRDLEKDPRSPPTRGEVLVMRNIDDILG